MDCIVDWSRELQTNTMAVRLPGLGYVVVIPDSQAQPASMGLKGAEGLLRTGEIDTSNYCGDQMPYTGKCGPWSRPFCYSTEPDDIVLNGPDRYGQYVERNYRIRQLELKSFVSKRKALIDAFAKVFLFGRSEGGMAASRFYHEDLHSRLSGMILSGWSCEFNYFVSCPEHARICEGRCGTDLPILNLMGTRDVYFGSANTSIASRVAKEVPLYGEITGNCKKTLEQQGFTRSAVVTFADAGHGIVYTHDKTT